MREAGRRSRTRHPHPDPEEIVPTLEILARSLDHPDVRPLLDRLDRELIDAEPEGGITFIHVDPTDVEPGNGAFYIAYVDGVPSACGAYRRIDERSAEVKRMWADPARRGEGLGAAILATIEQAAAAEGYRELRLETGEHLTAAVALYRRFGYTQCEPWGEYLDSPTSYCMAKQLV
jgi:GNAT superfamily N-acetyltransferase